MQDTQVERGLTVNQEAVGSNPTLAAMKCFYKHCNNELPIGKVKFCQTKCKNNHNTQLARKRIKQKAVDYKGGKCQRCGYCKSIWALSFHHTNPEEKDFNIGGNGTTRAWDSVKKELDKCILVCLNCHAEEHEKLGIN